MRSVIQGKLLYLKMVKGADNEVWRRLQRRLNKLTGNKSALAAATIKYKYTIADFEKKIGVQLQFEYDERGVLHCCFTLNEKRTAVALSQYARTRVTNVLAKNDLEQLEKFKNSYMLIFYEWNDNSLWRIERKRTWGNLDINKDFNVNALIEEIMAVTVAKEDSSSDQPTIGKNTGEILDALIASGFDLNILDEWDKIKSS